MFQEVIQQCTTIFQPDHPGVLAADFDLGEVLQDKGSLKEAKNRYDYYITNMERTLPGDCMIFRTLDALGIVEREMGHLEAALKAAQLAYASNIALSCLEECNDPYTLVFSNNLAEVLHAQGDLSGASERYLRCSAGLTNILGAQHPHHLMILNNFGRLSWDNNKDPMPFFTQAYQGFSDLLGSEHMCTLTVALNIARSRLMVGNIPGIYEELQRIRAAFTRTIGVNQPQVSLTDHFLGVAAAISGRLEQARGHFQSAMEGYCKNLGFSHPNCQLTVALFSKLLRKFDMPEADGLDSVIETQGLYNLSGDMVFPFHGGPGARSTSVTAVEDMAWCVGAFLPWGESVRLRWGRKTSWEEAQLPRLYD